ncbi:MAG: glycosyltransferase family 2 protein [Bacteroidia bacterium]
MSEFTPISVVIITFNEEKNIARCIDSVKEIADEIVVVDSFSNDKTSEIAKSKGAKVVLNKFAGHIEQKNFAITQAKYPHIFSLDADEMADKRLCDEIKKVKENWIADGYSMNRLNNFCGQWIRHGAWYPDEKLRLWDSRKGKWSGLNPHDKFEMKKGSGEKKLQGNILHYSFRSIEELKIKTDHFSDISSQTYFEEGIRSNVFKIIFKPPVRFIRDYFFRLGILDGRNGLVIALVIAGEVKMKYRKLLRLQMNRSLH